MAMDDRFAKFAIGNDRKKQGLGEQRLIKLYRNRSDLKKEFKRLDDQRYKLENDLDKKDAELKRADGQLAAFEVLLADPKTAFSTMVFYQLRGIWGDCNDRVKKLVLEMLQMRETRERQLHVAEFSKAQGARIAKLKLKEKGLRAQRDELSEIIEKLQSSRSELKGFWNYFKRHEFKKPIDEAEEQRADFQDELSTLDLEMKQIQAEQPPEFKGISIKGRRTINLVGIALAQHLYEHYSAASLYEQIRSAMTGRPQNASYGSRTACERIMQRISDLRASLDKQKGIGEVLRKRTDIIKGVVSYRADKDTIPLAKSLAELPGGGSAHEARLLDEVNLLADQVWNVQETLLT
jgi:predicted  nucleic acid-binding Zn-ribbon protein